MVAEGTLAVTACTCGTEDSGRASADEAAPVEDGGGPGVLDGEGGHGAEAWTEAQSAVSQPESSQPSSHV